MQETFEQNDNDERDSVDGMRQIAIHLNQDIPTMRGFSVVYQPQVDRERHIMGAEALLRWQPECGHVVGPDRFMPLLENSHHIRRVGLWVFEQAMMGLVRLRYRGFNLKRMSVNVSPAQLGFDHCELSEIAGRWNVHPTEVTLELTETQAVGDDQLYGFVAATRRDGFHWEIDDFGTGFASIRYLRKKQFSALKIDRSLLNAENEPPGLIGGICAMAKSIEMEVTCEGIETDEQFHRLFTAGCDHFQGYLFGKPMAISEWELYALRP